jgi:flagellar basal-body rod protein FlgB
MVAVNSRLFNLLSARQGWLGDRQTVLSRNIANADTPGFVPQDLSEAEFRRRAAQLGRPAPAVQMAATDPSHLPPSRRVDPQDARPRTAEGWEIAPSGNGVVLEQQAELMAHTQLEHQLGNDLYRKYAQMWRTAIGSGHG